MRLSFVLVATAGAKIVVGHAFVYSIAINGKDLSRTEASKSGSAVGHSNYIRSIKNNDPVKDVTSSAMTCNTPGASAPDWAPAKSGDRVSLIDREAAVANHIQLTIQWVHDRLGSGDDIIARSHKGLVQVYIAPAESNIKDPVWVKIAAAGFNGGWATDKLKANQGKHEVTLPHVAAGKYLLRHEIVALHEGNRVGGAQLYIACIQLNVSGSGPVSKVLKQKG
jgi:lytic cellulose monooxygenase (C1-hydroxylating)